MESLHAPGVFEIIARPVLPVRVLMREDLPTFERPMTANSGMARFSLGHCSMAVLLLTNSACFTFVCVGAGSGTPGRPPSPTLGLCSSGVLSSAAWLFIPLRPSSEDTPSLE